MVPMDMKLKFFKSGKFDFSPELIDRILKSRAIVFHFLTFLWHTLLNYQTLVGAFFILFNRTDLVNKTCGFGIQYVTIWNLTLFSPGFESCAGPFFFTGGQAIRLTKPIAVVMDETSHLSENLTRSYNADPSISIGNLLGSFHSPVRRNCISKVIEQNYFNACLLLDVLEKFPNPKYDKVKSFLKTGLPYAFSSIVFPLSILVTINFWGIYYKYPHVIDEDNVTQSFFPPWVNHGLHTTNLILAILEMFVVHRPYPTKLLGFLGIFSVLTAYCVTCTILYFIGGVWPYPLVGMMSLWQRFLYVTGNYALGFFIWTTGRNLNDKIWGQKTKPPAKDAKKLT